MPGAERHPWVVTATALCVVAVEVGATMVAAMALPAPAAGWAPWTTLAVALSFGLVGMAPMKIELSEQRVEWLLSEAVLVVALAHLAPAEVVGAAVVGQVICEAVQRKSPLKSAVNVATAGAAAAAACCTFSLRPAGLGPGTWGVALLAVGASCTTDALAVTTVVARAERSRTVVLLGSSLPLSLLTSCLAGTVGLVILLLLWSHPLAPLTLVPLAACLWVQARATARQRDEHQRVQRLYEATDRTSALVDGGAPLTGLADEARRLLTGTVALCAAGDTDGWSGAASGLPADLDVVALLRAAADGRQLPAAVPLPDALVEAAGEADTLLLARAPEGSGVDLLLGVARVGMGRTGLGDTLQAFAAHAAVVVATNRALDGLRASLEAQVQANRRKDEFVATISHELRTPLTVMLGSASTLERAVDRIDPDARDRLLHATVQQGKRLQALIEDLLLVAAGSSGRRECTLTPLPAADVLTDAVDDLPDDLRDRVSTADATGGGAALADRNRVRQVLANLVVNAGKYAGESDILVEAHRSGDQLLVTVVDHGPGIAPSDRERVFERFVQLDQSSTRRQGGTGLGLHLSRELARQMGGDVTVDETPGGGCTFTLSLPACDPPEADDDDGALDFGVRRPATVGS